MWRLPSDTVVQWSPQRLLIMTNHSVMICLLGGAVKTHEAEDAISMGQLIRILCCSDVPKTVTKTI